MNKKLFYLLPFLFCFILQGCLKDKLTKTYTILIPVYKEKSEVFANIKSNAPAGIQQPGKIFLYGNYIFLNEIDKGVHIIDNSNPANPVIKAFINIPGNLDIAVKGNTLYADMYEDLVVVDIANPLQASFVKHINNVFPERMYANGFAADSNKIIVDWIKKDTTVDINAVCNSCKYLVFANAQGGDNNGGPAAAPTTGIAGSMARFTIVNNYMYAVDHHTLKSISISNPADPVMTGNINAGWDIETIYPFKNKLFLGSMGGLFIFDITNPSTPVSQGSFNHARACDPVVADDDYAYVTLRSGTNCGPTSNELDVVNIQNLQSTVLVKTYPMSGPYGLAKENNVLFICDGTDGLKIYDATDPMNIVLKKRISEIETYDAIAWNNNLLVVAKDGLYQYDYTDPANLVQRSKLSVNR
jgi:hypothetical protein